MFKRWISILVLGCILFTGLSFEASAENVFLGFSDEDLTASGIKFEATRHLTIGHPDISGEGYAAQPFIPGNEPITGVRLFLRIGDNATVTVEIRKDLSDDPQSVVYSSSHPLTSDPHFTMDWWHLSFTRALKLDAGQTYYLVFWSQTYHSSCQACTTVGNVDKPGMEALFKPENSSNFQTISKKCYGFRLITDPSARADGYPFLMDDGNLLLHDCEEVHAFSRHGEETKIALDRWNMTYGKASLSVSSGKAEPDGRLLSAYVDFDHPADISGYAFLYADVLIPRTVPADFKLTFGLLDADGENGIRTEVDATGFPAGWQRLCLPIKDMTAVGTGSVSKIRMLSIGAEGNGIGDGLKLNFDHILLAKDKLPAYSEGYYTDEELDEVPDVSGIECTGIVSSLHGILYGDPTSDGVVNGLDASYAVSYAVGLEAFAERTFKAADVSGDDVVNSVDALLILQKESGRADPFPAQTGANDPPMREGYEADLSALTPGTMYTISTQAISQSLLGVMSHDAARLVASVQGLVNRQLSKTRIALVITETNSERWIPYIEEHSDILDGLKTERFLTFNQWMQAFIEPIRACGIVLWDPEVPATANLAATICGLDGYLPVKYDTKLGSLMNRLIDMGVPVKMDLCGMFRGEGLIPGTAMMSSGSAKCDVYLYALEKYASRCASDLLMYMPDGASATVGNPIYEEDTHSKSLDYNRFFNHDYGIYNRAFFFDLCPIDFEAPCDDPDQPIGTDVKTLREVLLNRYVRAAGDFGEIVGFPPWWFKYSAHNGWGSVVETSVESTFTLIIGQYNCYMDADGTLANCSIYTQYPLRDRYEAPANHKEVTETFDPDTVYLFMYTGDYDSAPWAVEHLIRAYDDPKRGTIPITWSLNPGLSRRVPMIFDYLYDNQTENDYFTAANSGAGYLRPQSLFQSQSDRFLPDGDKAWIKLNKELFEKFDLDAIGFLIGTPSDEVCFAYNQFAPVGSNTNSSAWSPADYAGTPYIRIKNGIGDPTTNSTDLQKQVEEMLNFAISMKQYHTAGFRTIKYTASEIEEVQETFLKLAAEKDPGTTYKFVDYKTYFAMLHESFSGLYVLE